MFKKMLEKNIQTQIMKYLKTHGGWWKKISDKFQKGIPDIIGCCDGKFVSIEVKRPGGRQTKYQMHEAKKIDEAGGIYFIANSVHVVKIVLKGYFKKKRGLTW
jgi:Holliday junction resolvase